jgi:hypothetical protein
MIWSPQRVLSNALEACDVPYGYRGGAIGLVDCDGIPAQTLVLTGTPAGVMFHPLNIWYAGAYLQRGDEVLTMSTHLGVLRNRVR